MSLNPSELQSITERYPSRKIALVGDFCLDRYLEIDPSREEVSIETGKAVHNVTKVRSQPGGAGTILNNLIALGIGQIHPIGFAGEDGEGFELRRCLKSLPGVLLDGFVQSTERNTFTYTKPLQIRPGFPPEELNRLDIKNWSPTPSGLQEQMIGVLDKIAADMDAIILLDQVDQPETGVVTGQMLEKIKSLSQSHPDLLILADSRQTLKRFPSVYFKMNQSELINLSGCETNPNLDTIMSTTSKLAAERKNAVFVTLAEKGMVGASPDGNVQHVPAPPLRGDIDIVGAGDSVTANLTAAIAAGASLTEAMHLAMAAASIVIHQLGTTGTASREEILKLQTS